MLTLKAARFEIVSFITKVKEVEQLQIIKKWSVVRLNCSILGAIQNHIPSYDHAFVAI